MTSLPLDVWQKRTIIIIIIVLLIELTRTVDKINLLL
jgi:hypothetical protein